MADQPAATNLVYLLQGEDPGLLSQALSTLLHTLEQTEGGLSAIEEYSAPSRDETLALGPVLDACRTPPFLAERRIVVARDVEGLDTAGLRELASYLAEPLPTTVLVLSFAKRAAPAALAKALPGRSQVIDVAPSTGARGRTAWFADQLGESSLRLNREAATLVQAHLGEDLARLDGLLATLEAAYGEGARLGVDEIEPYLGSAGGVAPWDLTDAIDRGETPVAMSALARMLAGGERHPLQVLATLHRHYQAMLRLDGAGITDEQGAAAATKLAPFPARKALDQSRRLGHERIARAIGLLASADLDLRGRSGLPPELVMEVLVARLCQLTRIRATAGGRRSQR